MARADLLKKLFIGYQCRDDHAFRQAAGDLGDEERRKRHTVLANELEKILQNGTGDHNIVKTMVPLQAAPMDSERKTALLEVRQPQRFRNELVVDDLVCTAVDRIIQEFRDWDVLEANGLLPIRRAA